MTDIKTIGFLKYENCNEEDTITPLEMFKGASMVRNEKLNPLPTLSLPANQSPSQRVYGPAMTRGGGDGDRKGAQV